MKFLSKTFGYSTSAICLTWSMMAHGQVAAPANVASDAAAVSDPSDIVVTAQRRSERLQDVPLSITALSGAALTRAPITNISDIQTSVPNVNISLHNSAGVVAIRGIGFDILTAGADGSVAIHTDGVFQSRPSAALGALYDVERIEVARGPQGTLYGRNATGGALNIISRKPTSSTEGYLNLSYGNYNSVAIEGAIGGPIAGEKLLGRIAAKVEQRDGWGTNLFNGKDVDDVKSRAVRGMLEFRPTETVSFLLTGEYFKRDDSGAANHVGGCVTLVCSPNAATSRGYSLPANPRDVDQDFQATYRPEQFGLSLTAKVELPFADLMAISGYRDGKLYWLTDFDGTEQPQSFLTREENYQTFSQELQLAHTGRAINWLVGGFYFHEKNYARANGHFVPFFAPALTDYFQGGTNYTNAYAAFGEISYHISPKFNVTVGGRYSHENKRIENEFTFTRGPVNIVARQGAPTAAIPCVTCLGLPNTVNFNAFTPKFGAQYKFSPSKMAYVTIQKGFKSGGFAVGAVTPAFRPETIWSYEAGLKASWFDRTLTTNIAAYHYDYKNLQEGQVVNNATQITNAAAAKVDGIEGEFRLALGAHVSFDGFGAYNYARFVSYIVPNAGDPSNSLNVPNPTDQSGHLLSNAPKWTAKIGAEYKTDFLGGSITGRGELFTSSRVYFSPFNNLNNSQGSYTLLNASLRYEGDSNWSAGLFINNISNRTVKASGVVGSGTVGAIIGVTYLPPRMYGLTVGKRF